MAYESANYIFVILFLTLGPLKVIPVFHALTHNADAAWRRQLALRAFLVSTIIVAFIAFCAIEILAKWRISINALVIAGGILLFLSAAEQILKFRLVDIPAKSESTDRAAASPPKPAPGWMSKPVLEPLAIPAIVTPTAVVAILFFPVCAQAARDDTAISILDRPCTPCPGSGAEPDLHARGPYHHACRGRGDVAGRWLDFIGAAGGTGSADGHSGGEKRRPCVMSKISARRRRFQGLL